MKNNGSPSSWLFLCCWLVWSLGWIPTTKAAENDGSDSDTATAATRQSPPPPPLPDVNCVPCLHRESYTIRVIGHTDKTNHFFNMVREASIQAGKDMRVNVDFELWDEYDEDVMANEIRMLGELAKANDPRAPDALVTSIPSIKAENAVRDAMPHIPIFGFNSGYDKAQELGLLGFVAMDEYLGGVNGGQAFLAKNPNIKRGMFVNHGRDNTAMTQRYHGFRDIVRNVTSTDVEEFFIDLTSTTTSLDLLVSALQGCPYDAILLGGYRSFDHIQTAMKVNNCDYSQTLVASFDTATPLFDSIAIGETLFAISQQQYLQGYLGTMLAAMYLTTGGKSIPSPLASEAPYGTYLSGPRIIDLHNLPSDTLQNCEIESFPICSNDKDEEERMKTSKCPCIDRSQLRIAGVLHGVTTDEFWDAVFHQSEQAAYDLGIELRLDRFEPQEDESTLYAKMANKISSLCQDDIDGLYVTIPNEQVVAAIKQCQELNVPVMSINSGADLAKELGVLHHLSQQEYVAGRAAGKRLLDAGMKEGLCLIVEETNVSGKDRCRGFLDICQEHNVPAKQFAIGADSALSNIRELEAEVSRDGGWDGIGILNSAQATISILGELKHRHPNFVAGTFDVNQALYDGLDNNILLFGVDQNPFVQGFLPVWMLTVGAYSKQHVVNTFLETGPIFVEQTPSDAVLQCNENHYDVCPKPVEIIYRDNLLAPGVTIFGYTATGISFLASLSFLGWIVMNRRRNVVKASQPAYLTLICVGALISSSTLIAISFQAGSLEDTTLASLGCTIAPFLYSIGWVLIFSSLCAKTFRMYKIMKNCANQKQEVVTFEKTFVIVLFALIIDMVIVVAWTITNPLEYKREELSRDEEPGSLIIESIGRCTSRDPDGPGFWHFAGPLLGFHFSLMAVTNVLLYLVKDLKDRYQESKYISIAMLLMSETLVVGVPIAVAVGDAAAVHVVLIGVIAVHDIGVLSLLFVPKIIFRSIADEEIHRKEDDVILASLTRASTSKFGDAVKVLDTLAAPDASKGLTATERDSLRLAKTLLIQGNHNNMMHVPEQLYVNRQSNDFILQEFAGVSFDRKDLNISSHVTDDSESSQDCFVVPEFLNALTDDQRRETCRLLSWSNIKRWEFTVLDLMKANGGHHPLLLLGWAILGAPYSQYAMARACGKEDVSLEDMDGYNFVESKLRIPIKTLCNYLRQVEADYADENPYHNATHAADVLQTLHCLIQMTPDCFETEEVFSILLAAAVHDVKHPGVNNAFQVNAKTNLALVYNDTSVLENQHAAHAFMLMLRKVPEDASADEDLNLLSNAGVERFAFVRSKVIAAVLGTDMSKHFALVDEIRGLLEDKSMELDAKERWNLLSFMLHAADISGQAKCDPTFKEWTERCLAEFFCQGDEEARMGLPISPLCNRSTTDKYDSQIGFINFVVKPTFEVLSIAIPEVADRILPVIAGNLSYWKEQAEAKAAGVEESGDA